MVNLNDPTIGSVGTITTVSMSRRIVQNNPLLGHEQSDCASYSHEAEQTAEIGKESGFEIESGNPIVTEFIRKIGVSINLQ